MRTVRHLGPDGVLDRRGADGYFAVVLWHCYSQVALEPTVLGAGLGVPLVPERSE